MRLLYQFGPGFERITPGALWADTRLGLRYLQMLDGCGAVSAPSIPTRSRSSSSAAPCGLYAGSISNSYQVEELLLGFGSTGTEQEEAAFGQSVKRAVA